MDVCDGRWCRRDCPFSSSLDRCTAARLPTTATSHPGPMASTLFNRPQAWNPPPNALLVEQPVASHSTTLRYALTPPPPPTLSPCHRRIFNMAHPCGSVHRRVRPLQTSKFRSIFLTAQANRCVVRVQTCVPCRHWCFVVLPERPLLLCLICSHAVHHSHRTVAPYCRLSDPA